jgi:hypothetical protein
MPLKMAILQFIDYGVTSRESGKKLNVRTIARNRIETVSQNVENLPMLQRAWGKGWFFQRRRRTQEMEMINEERGAAVPRDIMALKAIEEPRLIKARREAITKPTQRALRGTMNVPLTFLVSAMSMGRWDGLVFLPWPMCWRREVLYHGQTSTLVSTLLRRY